MNDPYNHRIRPTEIVGIPYPSAIAFLLAIISGYVGFTIGIIPIIIVTLIIAAAFLALGFYLLFKVDVIFLLIDFFNSKKINESTNQL